MPGKFGSASLVSNLPASLSRKTTNSPTITTSTDRSVYLAYLLMLNDRLLPRLRRPSSTSHRNVCCKLACPYVSVVAIPISFLGFYVWAI